MDAVEKTSADYHIRLLRPLAAYVREVHGAAALAQASGRAQLAPSVFDDGQNHWVSVAQFEHFVAAVREYCKSDEEYRRACTHRLAESYGPLRFVLWAASPLTVYR